MNQEFKNNRHQSPERQMLVGTGNQALITGALNNTGNSVRIGAGQLGIIPYDGGTGSTFITAGDLSADVPAVQVLLGSGNSSNTGNVSPMGHTEPAYYKSAPIFADQIISVGTYRYVPAKHSLTLMNGFSATPTVGDEYRLGITLESELRDIEFTHSKRDQHVVGAIAQNKTSDRDFLLQTLVEKINVKSEYLGGNLPFIALGIDYGGGAGTAIGGISAGDSVDFITYGGITYSFTATTEMVASFTDAIADTAALSTATIEVVNTSTAGASDKVDAILFLGLDEARFAAFDDSLSTKVTVKAFSDLEPTTNSLVCGPQDEVHHGRQYSRIWEKEIAPTIFDMTTVGHDYQLKTSDLTNPVSTTQAYTATVLQYWAKNETSRLDRMAHELTILLPAGISNASADANTGYTIATTASTTVTQLNAALGVWLEDANDKYNKIKTYGLISNINAPFV